MNRALKAQGLPAIDTDRVKREMQKKSKVPPVNAMRDKNARKMKKLLKRLSLEDKKPQSKKDKIFKGADSSDDSEEEQEKKDSEVLHIDGIGTID